MAVSISSFPEQTSRLCVICGSSRRRGGYPIDLQYARHVSGIDITRLDPRAVTCVGCGHQYIHPLPEPVFFERFYAAYMVQASKGFYRARAADTISGEFRARYGRWLDVLRREAPGERLLDIGAGLGMFLRLSRDWGFAPLALEPNAEACTNLKQRHGIESINASLESAQVEGQFDVVTMWDLLEHLPNPRAGLERAHAALTDGGVFALEIPVRDSLLHWTAKGLFRATRGIVRRPLYLVCGVHHLHYFSEAGLGRLLEDVGFEVLESHRGETSLTALHKGPQPSIEGKLKTGAYNRGLDAAFWAARTLHAQNKLIVFARKRA